MALGRTLFNGALSKPICIPVVSNIISYQDINWSARSSSQAIDDLMETPQEIQLDDSFSVSLSFDDTNIEQVAEDLIEMDALDATGNDHVDDVNIVEFVLE